MGLRFRGAYFSNYLWEALTDNGLWCVLLALAAFFTDVRSLRSARIVIAGGLLAFVAYLFINFRKYFQATRGFKPSRNKDTKIPDTAVRN